MLPGQELPAEILIWFRAFYLPSRRTCLPVNMSDAMNGHRLVNMYNYVYTYIYIYIYIYVCVCVCVCVYTYIYICRCVRVCVCAQINEKKAQQSGLVLLCTSIKQDYCRAQMRHEVWPALHSARVVLARGQSFKAAYRAEASGLRLGFRA